MNSSQHCLLTGKYTTLAALTGKRAKRKKKLPCRRTDMRWVGYCCSCKVHFRLSWADVVARWGVSALPSDGMVNVKCGCNRAVQLKETIPHE